MRFHRLEVSFPFTSGPVGHLSFTFICLSMARCVVRPEGLLLLLDYRGALPLLNVTTQQQHCSGLLECRYFLQEEINRTGSRLSDAGKAPGAVALIDPLFTTQSTVDGKAERILLLHKGSTIWLLSSPGSSSGMGESVKAGGLPTHGSMPSSFTWVKGMGRRAWAGTGLGQVCICCPGIVTHTHQRAGEGHAVGNILGGAQSHSQYVLAKPG